MIIIASSQTLHFSDISLLRHVGLLNLKVIISLSMDFLFKKSMVSVVRHPTSQTSHFSDMSDFWTLKWLLVSVVRHVGLLNIKVIISPSCQTSHFSDNFALHIGYRTCLTTGHSDMSVFWTLKWLLVSVVRHVWLLNIKVIISPSCQTFHLRQFCPVGVCSPTLKTDRSRFTTINK